MLTYRIAKHWIIWLSGKQKKDRKLAKLKKLSSQSSLIKTANDFKDSNLKSENSVRFSVRGGVLALQPFIL